MASAAQPGDRDAVLRAVRRSVRGVLEQTPAYAEATAAKRRELAHNMVTVAMMGADLVTDEAVQTSRAAAASRPRAFATAQEIPGHMPGHQPPAQAPPPPPGPAQHDFGESARNAGRTFQDLRQAIDFPTYVQSLITGVFQAITGS